MTRRIVIAPHTDGQLRELDSFDTEIPALVVNQDSDADGWVITHAPTGLQLGYSFPGPEEAMYAASLLRDMDWTADPATFIERGYGPRVRRALGNANYRTVVGEPVVRNEL